MRFLIQILFYITILAFFQTTEASEFTTGFKFEFTPDSRLAHAQELLGKKYLKSASSKVHDSFTLQQEIYTFTREQLPNKYKSKADKVSRTILAEAKKYKIDPIFLVSIIRTESAFNPLAVGTSGEIGLMQIKPDTAKQIAEKANIAFHGAKTLRDPVQNIKIGAAYFNYLRSKFDKKANRYIAAYNSGPGKISRIEKADHLPTIYPDKVLGYYEAFYKRAYKAQQLAKIAKND